MSYEWELARAREQRAAAAATRHHELPLFACPSTMARTADPVTAKLAAAAVARRLSPLQRRVYAAFLTHGPLTAKQAERLAEFADLGFSTVRKRISELHRSGRLADTGRTDAGCTVYEAVG